MALLDKLDDFPPELPDVEACNLAKLVSHDVQSVGATQEHPPGLCLARIG